MKEKSEIFNNIGKWLSPSGRINRQEYWILYMLPQIVILLLDMLPQIAILMLPLGILSTWLFIVGNVKRFHDTNLTGRAIAGSMVLWLAVLVIAIAVAFLLFLGSITGSGNRGLLDSAAIVVSVPFFLLIGMVILIGLVPGLKEENKHGPPSASMSKMAIKTIFISIALLGFITISLGTVQSYWYSNNYHEAEIIRAIKSGSLDEVNMLLKKGADPNQRTRLGTTALMLTLDRVAWSEHATVLIEHGADLSMRSKLESSAQDIERSPTQSYRDTRFTEYLPLTRASMFGDTSLVKLMLARGAAVNPEIIGEDEETPLMVALSRLHMKVVLILLDHGVEVDPQIFAKADLKLFANNEKTVLKENLEFVETLIKHGADVNTISEQKKVNPYYNKPSSPLLAAVQNWNFEMVQLLLRHNADPRFNPGNISPLSWAENSREDKSGRKKKMLRLLRGK